MVMDDQNPWWSGDPDPHLEIWEGSPLRWEHPILNDIDIRPYSLNFIIGPRQVGKTTMLKLLVRKELKRRDPRSIFYYSCDELTDFRELGEVIDGYISLRNQIGIEGSLLLLDEITFVKDWWRSLKHRIDMGVFKNDTVIVTGSASMNLLGHVDTFPGRRGFGRDHYMHPLSFSEYCRCIHDVRTYRGDLKELNSNVLKNKVHEEKLKNLWREYLVTGGFPRPIIDHAASHAISSLTRRSFIDWLKGDWNKAKKSDSYMKEIIRYIFRARGTPVSWNSMSTQTSINSPHTTRSYVEVLKSIFAVDVLDMITVNGRVDHKKNRKIHIADPFIYRALSGYVKEELDEGWFIEGTVASLIGRDRDAYYYRDGTEVDVVIMDGDKQIGFEISKGVKSWKRPYHLSDAHEIGRGNVHLYMASI